MNQEIDVRTSNFVAFVTLDVYEAVGGIVRRDISSDAQLAEYVTDVQLLQQLAADRLLDITQKVGAEEKWSWVETRLKYYFSKVARYGRVAYTWREYTKKERRMRTLTKTHDGACAALNAYYTMRRMSQKTTFSASSL